MPAITILSRTVEYAVPSRFGDRLLIATSPYLVQPDDVTPKRFQLSQSIEFVAVFVVVVQCRNSRVEGTQNLSLR